MMLVRLADANLATPEDIERLKTVHPVHLAERLGYSIDPEEWHQDAERLGIARFPRRFLQILRRALNEGKASVSGAANVMGLAEEDVEEFIADSHASEQRTAEEFEYLRAS